MANPAYCALPRQTRVQFNWGGLKKGREMRKGRVLWREGRTGKRATVTNGQMEYAPLFFGGLDKRIG